MHLFYAPGIRGNTYILSEEESRHSIRVLRLKEGDIIHLTDGNGNLFNGRLADIQPKGCHVEILKTVLDYHRRPFYLHIGIAPTKNTDRLEWFLEKTTEIGIEEVTPLICTHSERTVIKPSRLEKVLVSAMKQSLKALLPKLNEPVAFNEMIRMPFNGQKFIAYCETGKEDELQKLYLKGSDALILIGPEGDFSQKEIDESIREGFIPVSLGKSRLRTETAGIVACHTISLINEKD